MRRDECLDGAKAAVMHERNRVYGDPMQNFIDMARLWSVVLGIEVTPTQVALCLLQLKVSRLINTPEHADSWVDIAGYAACGAEVSTKRDAKPEPPITGTISKSGANLINVHSFSGADDNLSVTGTVALDGKTIAEHVSQEFGKHVWNGAR